MRLLRTAPGRDSQPTRRGSARSDQEPTTWELLFTNGESLTMNRHIRSDRTVTCYLLGVAVGAVVVGVRGVERRAVDGVGEVARARVKSRTCLLDRHPTLSHAMQTRSPVRRRGRNDERWGRGVGALCACVCARASVAVGRGFGDLGSAVDGGAAFYGDSLGHRGRNCLCPKPEWGRGGSEPTDSDGPRSAHIIDARDVVDPREVGGAGSVEGLAELRIRNAVRHMLLLPSRRWMIKVLGDG